MLFMPLLVIDFLFNWGAVIGSERGMVSTITMLRVKSNKSCVVTMPV